MIGPRAAKAAFARICAAATCEPVSVHVHADSGEGASLVDRIAAGARMREFKKNAVLVASTLALIGAAIGGHQCVVEVRAAAAKAVQSRATGGEVTGLSVNDRGHVSRTIDWITATELSGFAAAEAGLDHYGCNWEEVWSEVDTATGWDEDAVKAFAPAGTPDDRKLVVGMRRLAAQVKDEAVWALGQAQAKNALLPGLSTHDKTRRKCHSYCATTRWSGACRSSRKRRAPAATTSGCMQWSIRR